VPSLFTRMVTLVPLSLVESMCRAAPMDCALSCMPRIPNLPWQCFAPVGERWVADNAGKGPSREIYDYLTQLLEQ
jgi:hypothetical protein